MKQYVINILTLLFISFTLPVLATVESEHKEHNRIGHHGMVLFTDGSTLYASHLPLYQSPHDYQLIYAVELNNKEIFIEELSNNMVTILPAKFDLNRLIDGDSFSIETKMYRGHFERGGKLIETNLSFTFKTQIFKRQISKNQLEERKTSEQESEHFFLIPNTKLKHNIAIHKIQARPSFDMISLISNQVSCAIQLKSNYALMAIKPIDVLEQRTVENQLNTCGNTTTLYFETQDFAL